MFKQHVALTLNRTFKGSVTKAKYAIKKGKMRVVICSGKGPRFTKHHKRKSERERALLFFQSAIYDLIMTGNMTRILISQVYALGGGKESLPSPSYRTPQVRRETL